MDGHTAHGRSHMRHQSLLSDRHKPVNGPDSLSDLGGEQCGAEYAVQCRVVGVRIVRAASGGHKRGCPVSVAHAWALLGLYAWRGMAAVSDHAVEEAI